MSQTSETTMYLLSSFSSLFEVAVGLNLVFSIWDGLRNQAVERFKKVADELNGSLELSLGTDYKNSRCAAKFSEKQNEQVNSLERLSWWAKVTGLSITALLITLLIFMGYMPETKLSFWPITILVGLSTVISPSFLVFGNYKVRRSRIMLEEYQQQQSNTFLDMKDLMPER